MSRKPPTLSKSRFLAGLQCPLRLWYQCFHRELASPVTPVQQALFDTGHEVGRMATRRYPRGVWIQEDFRHHEAALQSTLEAMADPGVGAMFEAAYTQDGVRVRADIMERTDSGHWNLIEVKSATGVKAEYLTDVAVQAYVLQRAGVELERICLTHIDRDYVLGTVGLDLDGFFNTADLTEDTLALQDFVRDNLDRLEQMLVMEAPPDVPPSRHCHQPHTCEFWEHCTRNTPENWIFELCGIRQERFEDLCDRGVGTIEDIPEDFPLTAMQERMRDCVAASRAYVSSNLESALMDVMFPVHFLDFETVMPAIPRYVGTRPYQTLPFQWSDHVLRADGRLEHREFLCDADVDPRTEFTRTLLAQLVEEGTVWIYTAYEKRIVRELGEHLPRHADVLKGLLERFKDLWALIREHYYHPAFHGSFSLKHVLPVLVPDMGYQDLAIQEGGTASQEYLRMIDPGRSPAEKAAIRDNLLAYCRRDTLAMVRIREALLKAVMRDE